jgi:hypothetical protein
VGYVQAIGITVGAAYYVVHLVKINQSVIIISFSLSQSDHIHPVQWALLNGITDNIIVLSFSVFQSDNINRLPVYSIFLYF